MSSGKANILNKNKTPFIFFLLVFIFFDYMLLGFSSCFVALTFCSYSQEHTNRSGTHVSPHLHRRSVPYMGTRAVRRHQPAPSCHPHRDTCPYKPGAMSMLPKVSRHNINFRQRQHGVRLTPGGTTPLEHLCNNNTSTTTTPGATLRPPLPSTMCLARRGTWCNKASYRWEFGIVYTTTPCWMMGAV